MKNFKLLFVIAIACLLVIPFTVFAEENEEATEQTNEEAIIYLFYGEGCPHCAEFEEWIEEIEDEYGKYFKLVSYETWNNQENAELMQKVADTRGEEASGVPYIIIGNKSWNGFADDYKDEILSEIKGLYETKKSERYDVMKLVGNDSKDKSGSTTSDVIALLIILCVTGLIVFGIVSARKSTN